MLALILILTALLAVAITVAVHYYNRSCHHLATADRQKAGKEELAQQIRAAEQLVELMTRELTTASSQIVGGGAHQAALAVPSPLMNTQLAHRLDLLAGQCRSSLMLTLDVAQGAAQEQLEQVQRDAAQEVARVRQEAENVARAAVRAFASSTVQRASKLSKRISEGVRRHVSDEAYETLEEIDHLVQQMVTTASGYAVVAGDRLSKRHPATTLTDVVRAAMGRVDGYQRVQHLKMDAFAVEGRAVEAVILTLAVVLDNALRYSPPAADVHVSLAHGHSELFVTVDDAGVQMNSERLEWARKVMSSVHREDITGLGAYPQTGLRVAAILAAHYGFRVDIAVPSVYGGTRVLIALPQKLLTTPPSTEPLPAACQEPVPGAQPAPEPVVAAASTASGLPQRVRSTRSPRPSPGPDAVTSVQPGRHEVVAAWRAGSLRGREELTTSEEERD
ncbi:ATP-binding protein [Streptomyces lydicus]|uniref:ATP-binding protein n=1 Tax=Streptomyces lydicus TaxID=47763 RepID=UPI0010107BC4|nr:ATP-binding protein [Streptomyces lydicus]MCZ1012244.1 ATP-binding protein [Streptomyces lydicus]